MITIQEDQYPWLRKQKQQFLKELKNESNLVFAPPTNIVEHSVPRYLRDVMRDNFRDLQRETLKKDFHSNSSRKMWDTYVNDSRESILENLRELYLKQTAHSEKTALANYIVYEGKNSTLELYQQTLNKDEAE